MRSTLRLAALCLLVACGEADPVDDAAPDVPTAAEPSGDAPAATDGPAPAQRPAAEAPQADAGITTAHLIRGTWQVALDEQRLHQVEVMKLALKDPPPTEAELDAANLTDDEKKMVGFMVAAKANNPDDPKVTEMATAVAGLAEATLTITDTDMTMSAGTMSRTSTYTVASEGPGTITLTTTDGTGETETVVLTVDGDTLGIADAASPNKSQDFVRKK